MSDYEVSLVNDSMQEFYVRFYGPDESESNYYYDIHTEFQFTTIISTLFWRCLEDSC